ncbi:hypothetical protein TNCV_3784921 [Trichonephila clavipes]|nr:hypothetical protein TNCV_3784921 [Trichonephila clavipes]
MVKSGEIHLIQTTHVPILIYELPASSLKCQAQRNVIKRSFEPYDQMLYHRTILEPHTAYPIPAGTNYIVLTVQKPAFATSTYPNSCTGRKATFGKKSLPFSKKRSKVRITPVMRRVSSRPELPMAPVQIPQVPQPPVQIPDVSEPVQIPVSQVPQPPVQIPPVQIPVSHVPQPPVQIPHVQEPVQILHVSEPVQIPVSHVPQSPVQIPQVPEPPVQIPMSQVPQSPVQIPLVPEPPVQIPHVPEPLVQILYVPEPMHILHVPEPMQILPELDTLDPLESTLDQLMLLVFGPPAQELQLLHTVPAIFDGDLISFLDEFERRLWT